MKKISLLLISLFVSLGAHSEWTNVLPGNNASLYIDFETLEEKDGFIYWWYMDTWSTGSEKTYAQGDCNLKGFKVNKRSRFPFPMGEGEGVEKEVVSAWEYYAPNSGFDVLLSFICEMSRLTPEEKGERIEILNKRNEEFERQRKEALNKNFMLWNFWCFDPQEFWEYVSNYNPYIIILCKDEARSYSAGMYLRQEGYQKSYCFKFLEFNNMKSLLKSIINPLQ